ncbi:undecaprenyl-diphosphatase [Aneurinibacillus sp. Ricciae_BoGa-3]|uniref:undecaprenyl-diphosphatase n=1 Tax=Aneurinibacillus sp. Ricciae_BoGa-3 TaxID=3022697 RepID=UPI00233FEE8E|nr:undecaprenyl-diphosphatase [Aneurinibacillus sp. Ricciae_BoGa-3]WCK52932.1 undecaprenyl-diphosphatase [Aneurinibacillus sp. Ricciae_BoGa-3]
MNYYLFHLVNQWAGKLSWLDAIMCFITNYALVIYALILIAIWLAGNKMDKRSVLYAGITGVLAIVFNLIISKVYFEPRPFITHHVNLLLPHPNDASFPSDHTSGAFGLAIAMLMFKPKWGYGMLVLAVLTGFSRIFVGHHYPGDVLGSIIVAIISAFLISKGKRLLEPVVRLVIAIYEKVTSRLPFVSH